MMKLDIMQAVMATVDSEWHCPLADQLAGQWPHDPGQVWFWRVSANFVFVYKHGGQDFILRFNHASERTAAQIVAELAYVNALAERGIRVARPIPSLAGNLIESVSTTLGEFHAVVFEKLPGEQLEVDDLSGEQFNRWGRALAALHEAATQIEVTGRSTWQDQLAFVAATVPAAESVIHQAVDRTATALQKLPITPQNYGLIHYDFELDNLIWHNGQPGIIDFDDCTWSWFAADIALALGDLIGESAHALDLQNEAFQQFLAGYRAIRAMNDAALHHLPLFIQAANLYTFARLYRALTPVNEAGELPWMAGLRDKLAAKMAFIRDDLARGLPES